MTETLLGHPADSAEGMITYGGFAEIARRLNALHPERQPPFSRQLVSRWYKCRETNGFPEREPREVEGGRILPLFNLQAVDRWHRTEYKPRQRSKPIETIPLFNVDRQGCMIA